ncbi:MAG: dNTP triphosphohydrolase [Candidatus Peribacteraceae bacterium]|mgnify:CR=1 FL=1|jgi:dGTPase|nr:dNTP triphosphohydrolase [Candidatus Peribacteraceae bacterium]|tara:strand:+ start:5981 stop:7018 length:1038 start_codon:yes stop_codon:yes gene_type:complete
MQDLKDRIKAANQLLAPYAVPHEGKLGRVVPEAPDATRFPFQRDRDRIIHSRSFRRLKGKTQVFVSGVGDHYRTRLTHTVEVAQISRDMARTLGLNEDLTECIALAHDLGHPPFGHAGEDALNSWMESHGSGFEHNRQSLRIVTVLDKRSSQYTGLNLNTEVLEGLMKHRTPFDKGLEGPPSLEAQVVNIADEIAYTGHDVDDGLRAKLFTIDDLSTVQLIQEVQKEAEKNDTSLRGALIHMLVMDIYEQTDGLCPVQFSPALRQKLDELRNFLWKNMYLHPQVLKRANHGKEIVIALCNHLLDSPSQKVEELMRLHGSERFEAVKDYVCGMTDDFAEQSSIHFL